jgi:hypothetical protein
MNSSSITDLGLAIDQIGSSFKNKSDLILELARVLDESGHCEQQVKVSILVNNRGRV